MKSALGSRDPTLVWGIFAAAVSLGLLTIHPVLAFAPVILVPVVWLFAKLPIRSFAYALFTAAFVLEVPGDMFCAGMFQTPWAILGALLFGQLKHTIPVGALVFTGMDLLLLVLLLVHAYRKATGTIKDRIAIVIPKPLYLANFAALGGILFALVWGIARGGSFRFMLWQIQRLMYVPLLFLFFSMVFSTSRDAEKVGRILLGASLYRAVMAIILRRKFPDLEYVTTHTDSLLFATTTCMLIIRYFEERSKSSLYWLLGCLPILVLGMIENDRRLVWVEIIVGLAAVFFQLRTTLFKITLMRSVLLVLPVIPLYLAIGWNSGSAIFKPVKTLKSVVDSKSDASTMWRDLENFNLIATLKKSPVFGSGFGHPFDMVMPMPDVTAAYELEPYAPHNAILGMWTFLGYFGFMLQWSTLLVTSYLCLRIARVSKEPRARTIALTMFCTVVAYMLHLYGDMALGTVTSIFLLGAGMVLIGKLAVETGAYPEIDLRATKTRVRSGEVGR